MSHNYAPKIYNGHQYNQQCVLSSKKWMKNLHQNLNQLKSQENMDTSSGSKKSHQYIHEYVYHKEITKDFTSNNNVLQSYTSSPKCWTKFLQHQMNQVLSKKNHVSSSDSNEHHSCTHVDVYNHNVNKNSSTNLNNMVL